MLDIDKFTNGIAILEKCYKGFNLNTEETSAWYEIIKSEINEDAFLPLIFNYCKSESAPKCPADIINFGKKALMDAYPVPSYIAKKLIESAKRLIWDIGLAEEAEDNMKNMTSDLVMYNPEFRQESMYLVVLNLVKQYCEVLIDTVRYNERTEISILTSEIKSSYRKELNKTISRTVLTTDALEGMHPLLLR